jgi:hypothetical protein
VETVYPLRYKGRRAGIVTYSSMQATCLGVLGRAGNALRFPFKIMENTVRLSGPFSGTNYNRITRVNCVAQ